MGASSLQNHCLKLLCEIDGICNRYGISYSLAEHSAWDGVKFRKYHGGMYDTCIMMTADSLAKLGKALEELSDVYARRAIVSDGRGSSDGKSKRYIDTGSTLFDFAHPKRFKYAAVGVDIRILSEDGSGSSLLTVKPDGKALRLPKSLFDRFLDVEIEGRTFPVVADFDAYFTILVSGKWRTEDYPFPVSKEPATPYNLIYSADLPFEAFFRRPIVKKALSPWAKAKRKAYSAWRKKRYDKIVAAPESYCKYLTRTEDRFILWERYYPQKSEILEMAGDGDRRDELRERLAPFIEAVDKHKKKGLGFCFDEDILQIALPILREEKGDSYVKELVKMIPDAYRTESVDQLLRRNDVNHSLM